MRGNTGGLPHRPIDRGTFRIRFTFIERKFLGILGFVVQPLGGDFIGVQIFALGAHLLFYYGGNLHSLALLLLFLHDVISENRGAVGFGVYVGLTFFGVD